MATKDKFPAEWQNTPGWAALAAKCDAYDAAVTTYTIDSPEAREANSACAKPINECQQELIALQTDPLA
jgi:hypothetical protein